MARMIVLIIACYSLTCSDRASEHACHDDDLFVIAGFRYIPECKASMPAASPAVIDDEQSSFCSGRDTGTDRLHQLYAGECMCRPVVGHMLAAVVSALPIHNGKDPAILHFLHVVCKCLSLGSSTQRVCLHPNPAC